MIRHRTILIAPAVVASLAALGITGCGGSDNGPAAASAETSVDVASDERPGDTNGEDLTQIGGGWYAESPSGRPIEGITATSSGGGSGY